MPETPEAVQPVEGHRGVDTKGNSLPTFVDPLDVRIFDIRDDISALELAAAVGFETKPCAERVAVSEVVREVEASKPQPMLSVDWRRVGAADRILMPVVVPVVVPEHQPAELVRRKLGRRGFVGLGKRLSRKSVLEVVQIDRGLAVEDDRLTVRTVRSTLDDRAGLCADGADECLVSR